MGALRTASSAAFALLLTALMANSGSVEADPYDIPVRPHRAPVDARYFGTQLHRLVADRSAPWRVTPWPEGVAALRLWDCGMLWAEVEPERGRFDFRRIDAYVDQAQAHGAEPLMVLGMTPRWASSRPDEPAPYGLGGAAEPTDLADWDTYVTALARRYKGRIKTYELWNEPYFSDLPQDRHQPHAFFSGSVHAMVALAQRAHAVLQREDPDAVLLSPGFVGGVERFELFLQAGGGREVGGVAYHYYAATDRDFLQLDHDIVAAMARHGIAALSRWNTESGFAAQDGNEGGQTVHDPALPDRAAASSLLARSMVLGAYVGIDRFYQYAWDNDRSGMRYPNSDQPTPSAHAYQAVRRWLLGTTLLGCRTQASGVVGCSGTRDGRRMAIWWQVAAAAPLLLPLPGAEQPASIEYASSASAIDVGVAASDGLRVGSDPVAVWWPSARAEPRRPASTTGLPAASSVAERGR